MKKNSLLLIFLFLFNFANASDQLLSQKDLMQLEQQISKINKETKIQKKSFKDQDEALNNADKIRMMAYDATILKNKILQKSKNLECLSVMNEINQTEQEIQTLINKNHPAFQSEIKQLHGVLNLAKNRMKICKGQL